MKDKSTFPEPIVQSQRQLDELRSAQPHRTRNGHCPFCCSVPPRRLIELSNVTHMASRTLAENSRVVDLSRLDRETLEALVVAQQEKLLSRNSEIEHLKLIIAKLRRMMFGTKSEKIAREVEQLELKLEELETSEAARPPAPAPASSTARQKRKRRPLPEHLPRETHTHMPAEEACAECGGQLSKLGEDVSEMLEYIPASFKVIRHVRPSVIDNREALLIEIANCKIARHVLETGDQHCACAKIRFAAIPSRGHRLDSRPEWSRFSFSVGLSHPLQCAGLSRRSLSCFSSAFPQIMESKYRGRGLANFSFAGIGDYGISIPTINLESI